MTETEFFYWLQGYFELALLFHSVVVITKPQAECIMRHIDLVEAFVSKTPRPRQIDSRVFEVRALCRALVHADNDAIRSSLTIEIKDICAAQFQHVIDPQAGGPEKQEHLNSLHNQHLLGGHSGGGLPPGVTARC